MAYKVSLFSISHCIAGSLTCLVFLKCIRHAVSSQPVFMLLLLSGLCFPPDTSMAPSLTSFGSLFKCYLTWKVFPDDLILSSIHPHEPHLSTPPFSLPFSVFPLQPIYACILKCMCLGMSLKSCIYCYFCYFLLVFHSCHQNISLRKAKILVFHFIVSSHKIVPDIY